MGRLTFLSTKTFAMLVSGGGALGLQLNVWLSWMPVGDGLIPVNIHSTRLALFLEVLVLGYVAQVVVMAVLMVLVMAMLMVLVIMAVHVVAVMAVPKTMG